ncbi:YetF domain-containing protein [Acetohalobium arabaticum]|uniref:YetF domain-containing protein n=1 Tax=Acetohalobium arabaticum TaxID=28187 RepID=UPI000A05B284
MYKSTGINISQLQSLLRQKDVLSFKEIEYAILEPNGEITVLNKYQYGTPKREDLNLTQQDVHMPIALISDGQVLKENLRKCGLDKEWLEEELFNQGIHSFQDVIHAEWSEEDGLYVIPFQ